MKNLRIISIALMLMGTFTISSIAQTPQNHTSPEVFYIKIDNLDVDNYTLLHHTLKADGRFTIDLACVPGKMLTIRMIGPRDADMNKNLQQFQVLATQAQLATAQLLGDFDAQRFYDACSTFRNGSN